MVTYAERNEAANHATAPRNASKTTMPRSRRYRWALIVNKRNAPAERMAELLQHKRRAGKPKTYSRHAYGWLRPASRHAQPLRVGKNGSPRRWCEQE